MLITIYHYLFLSAILFCIGVFGILKRKNLLMLFFCTEILLNSVNIALVAIGKLYSDLSGQIFALIIIGIAASEVVVGLGLVILWFRHKKTIDLDSLNYMNNDKGQI